MDWKDILARAAKTAVQAGTAALAAALAGLGYVDGTPDGLKSAAITVALAAGSAALSAAWNVVAQAASGGTVDQTPLADISEEV